MAAATIRQLFTLNTATSTSDALSTGRRVSDIDCAKIASTIAAGAATSERKMARADDSPPAGRTGAMGAHKNNKNHTTINLDAGRGTRGRRRFETTQQSAERDG
eukprot:scaffold50560_cov25-Cyclotella_meneghiniana.AAC.1